MPRTPVRLIGREAELARLTIALDAARSGEAAFRLVLGEAGIGKSALLAATMTLAADRGLRVLAGSAVETGRSIPYLPMVGPLATAIEGDERTGRDAAAAKHAVRSVVRGALPGERIAPDVDAAASAGAARFIEAVFEVLVARPTLLIVDDVHWADRSTITLLDYLSRRAADAPLAIVAAARDDEPSAVVSLPIADGRRFEQIPVSRLGRGDVADQVADLLGHRAGTELVDELFERSAGNPMFVEELVGAVGADGRSADGGSTTAIASTAIASAALRSLVLGRVGRLSPAARSATEALAVVGRPADEALIGAVAGLDEAAIGPALEDAIAGGVVVSVGPNHDVRHPIVGEVVVDTLSAATSRRLHRRAAEALDGRSAPGVAAERARHWSAAGDDRRAWTADLEATDEAMHAFAFAEAAVALRHAARIWPPDEPGLARAELRAADAIWLSGDPELALEVALSAQAHVGASGDGAEHRQGGRDFEVELDIALGRYGWDAGERELSTRAFTRAIERLDPDVSPALRARALWGVGRGRIGEGRYDESYRMAIAAANAAHEGGVPAWEAEGWLLAGMAEAWSGKNGIEELRRGIAVAVESGDPGAIGHAHLFLVDMLGLAGQREAALALAMDGIVLAERVGIGATHGSDLRGDAALLLIETGRWADADAVLAPADPRAIPSYARALLAMRRGDLATADDEIVAITVGRSIGGRGIRGGPLELARAEAAWLRGDRATATRELDSVTFSPGVWGIDFAAWRAFWRAKLGTATSEEPRPRHTDARLDAALEAEIEAELAGADVARWDRASGAWAAIGWPYHEAWARLRQAEAGFAARDRDAARFALDAAIRLADELGAVLVLERAEDLARRSRVVARPTRRVAADPSELTAREREVLALLAEGRTNRQIADALFLSNKTVEIHVSRILDKLGAGTRGEAVAIARRSGLLTTAD